MSRRLGRGAILLAAIGLLAAVVLYNWLAMRSGGETPLGRQAPAAQAQRPDVSVVTVTPDRYQARARGYGQAAARFELTLTAQVQGRVEDLASDFDKGRRVAEDTVLVRLDDTDYRAAVASAEDDLAAARLTLLEEERQGVQARAEWRASGLGGEPDSELVLRGPQLAATQAAVANAEAALASASEDLAKTRIRAPFDALVIARAVAPGSFVQSGTEVATLYSTDRIEVEVFLSAREWANLPDQATLADGQWPVTLTSVEDGRRWTGHVLRVAQHLDEETRQRALIAAVDAPLDRDPPLFPGTFLELEIAGRLVDGLWRLPSTALSQRGEVWYLRDDDTLASFAAEPLFSAAGAIYVRPPEALAEVPQRVLVHPLNGYLQGMAVRPVEVTGDE